MSSAAEGKKLRIGFIHPDLGIGGAERLVVDAAVSLQRLGHNVTIFTSRHDPTRCFEETRDGTLKVHVLGSSLPMRLTPRIPLTILFSILRSIALTFFLISSLFLPAPASFVNPVSPLDRFDIFFVDQQSVCVPLLRWIAGTRVVFYCHFPDKLLSGGWEIGVNEKGESKVGRATGARGGGLLKRLYRWPVDKLEEFTTGQADIILSNSKFTSKVYARSFPSLAKRPPRVVYPCIDADTYQQKKQTRKGKAKTEDGVDLITSDRPTLISLNRFEAKKNVGLAIDAFASLHATKTSSKGGRNQLRLVIGGGYDTALSDNVNTLSSLREQCDALGLSHHTLGSDSSSPPADVQVLFLLNFTTAQRTALLTCSNTLALLYTPANEHFGIVPIEAMACGLPVLAADSGGPTETIVDLSQGEEGTGYLRPPNKEEWGKAVASLVELEAEDRVRISAAAKRRVRDQFSLETLGKELEAACRDACSRGDIHTLLGDKIMWGGAGMMLFAVVAFAITVLTP